MTAANIKKAAAVLDGVRAMLGPIIQRQAAHSAALRCEAPRTGAHGLRVCDAENVQATLAAAVESIRRAAHELDTLNGAREVQQ